MNVYDHIAANNRKTILVLLAFPVALFMIVFLSLCVLIFLLESPGSAMEMALADTLEVFPWLLLAALVWLAIVHYAGGEMILRMANARPVTLDENRDLFRLVENTAIMAGLPTPNIYLIDSNATNAFATGRSPETATIAFTTGIVEKLTKAELQAVVAHELAHVGNRDTRLMVLTVAGIGCFAFLGELLIRVTFRGGGRGGRGGGKAALVLLAIGIACLIFGYVVAPIIRAALSRRREFQADATAAKITRDPLALARALEKVAIDSKVAGFNANPLAGNLCIANPSEASGLMALESKLYSTHPPIGARITALENMMGIDKETTSATPTGRAIW